MMPDPTSHPGRGVRPCDAAGVLRQVARAARVISVTLAALAAELEEDR